MGKPVAAAAEGQAVVADEPRLLLPHLRARTAGKQSVVAGARKAAAVLSWWDTAVGAVEAGAVDGESAAIVAVAAIEEFARG